MSEHDEQATLFRWAGYLAPKYPALDMMFAIPNGGLRDIRVARKLKAEGVKPGVPDIFLAARDCNYKFRGLFIEMKIINGRITPEQKEWLPRLNDAGYKAVCCFGWPAAALTIAEYLGISKDDAGLANL